MSERKVVNLRQARKVRDRAERKADADANAAKFGRTKAQRMLEAAQAERMRRHLDGQRFEDE